MPLDIEQVQKAIAIFQEDLDRLSTQGKVSKKFIEIRSEKLGVIIDYINDSTFIIAQLRSQLRTLVKACTAFDVSVPMIMEHSEKEADMLLLFKQEQDMSFLRRQERDWTDASYRGEIFTERELGANDHNIQRLEKMEQTAEVKKLLEDLVRITVEYEEFIETGLLQAEVMGKEILHELNKKSNNRLRHLFYD